MRQPLRIWTLGAIALGGCSAVSYDPVMGFTGDRDGDGWADHDEQLAGSDPSDPYFWDFDSGEWPDFTDEAAADGVSGTGWGIGDTIPDFVSVDQFGNPAPFYTFYGYVVILEFGAGWCEPCEASATASRDFWVEHRLDGVVVIHQLLDDYSPDGWVQSGFAGRWARDLDLEMPVLVDEDQRAYLSFADAGLTDGLIPFQVLIDRDFTIRHAYVGTDGALAAQERALELAR